MKSTRVSILDKLKAEGIKILFIFNLFSSREKFLKLILRYKRGGKKKEKNIGMLAFSRDPFNLTPGREELSKEKWKKNGLYVAILQKALPRSTNECHVRSRNFDRPKFRFLPSLQISFVFLIQDIEVLRTG